MLRATDLPKLTFWRIELVPYLLDMGRQIFLLKIEGKDKKD